MEVSYSDNRKSYSDNPRFFGYVKKTTLTMAGDSASSTRDLYFLGLPHLTFRTYLGSVQETFPHPPPSTCPQAAR
jgi:hypothetical protein